MSTDIVKIADNLPRALPAEQTTRDAAAFIHRWNLARSEQRAPNLSYHEHLLQVAEAVLPESETHLARIQQLSAPASKVQIANHLALLLKSFPNAGKDNAEVFGRMLCEDVGAQQPTIGALEAACRVLRRTSRFIPTIAEALEALTAAEESQRKTIAILKNFPGTKQSLVARVADDKVRQAEWDRECREAREAKLRRQRAGEINSDLDLPF